MQTDAVILWVRDTGCGIPPEHLPFVFDRFYKVDPARAGDRPVGCGLGLSIVKAIAERHGGRVSACSEPGVATVFAIHLPVNAASWPGSHICSGEALEVSQAEMTRRHSAL